MNEPDTKGMVEIRDFRGLFTDADPHDIHPGATREQVNITNVIAGQVTVRKGLREVSFEN